MPCAYEPGSPADAELRLQCARLVDGRVEQAREIYEFVTGKSDASPIERARAALDEIETERFRKAS